MVRRSFGPYHEEFNTIRARHPAFQDLPENMIGEFTGTFEVDEIIDVRGRGRSARYKVRWAFPYDDPSHDTWEKKSDLTDCPEAMQDFYRHRDNARKQAKNKALGSLDMRSRLLLIQEQDLDSRHPSRSSAGKFRRKVSECGDQLKQQSARPSRRARPYPTPSARRSKD